MKEKKKKKQCIGIYCNFEFEKTKFIIFIVHKEYLRSMSQFLHANQDKKIHLYEMKNPLTILTVWCISLYPKATVWGNFPLLFRWNKQMSFGIDPWLLFVSFSVSNTHGKFTESMNLKCYKRGQHLNLFVLFCLHGRQLYNELTSKNSIPKQIAEIIVFESPQTVSKKKKILNFFISVLKKYCRNSFHSWIASKVIQ